MRFLRLLIGLIGCIVLGCSMDPFLFNSQKTDKYTLPNNTIDTALIEEVTMESEGNQLYGFWVASKGAGSISSAMSFTGVTILYNHGNKSNLDYYWDRVMMLHELGVNIFIYDYRGFGRSEGSSTSEGTLYADAGAALRYVLSRGVPASSLCIYGYSLGNVPAIYLAAREITPLCLISEAPFASVNSLEQSGTALALPAGWLTNSRYDNAAMIAAIQTPYLLFHGSEDDFVRYRDNGKVIYENAPEPKQLRLVLGANHTDVPQTMGIDNYLRSIGDWIVCSSVSNFTGCQ